MLNIKEGQKVCISTKALYDSGSDITFGRIVPDYDENGRASYFDLYNSDGELACCDGEVCYVEQVGKLIVTLISENGGADGSTVRFELTSDELEIATFS